MLTKIIIVVIQLRQKCQFEEEQNYSIQVDIDYHGSSRRKKHDEEKVIQNQINQYQQAQLSFEKTSDIVHYLKDLIKNELENQLPKFNELFQEIRNAINDASEELESGNIPLKVEEIVSGIVEKICW